jgi:membrane-associated phospholipid phosphatase
LARIITEVFAPAPMALVAVAIVAWTSARTPLQAVAWTLIGAAFAPVFPFLHLVRQVRRGAVTDHHVARREQRPRVLALALASTGLGLLLLRTLGAPPELVALLGAGGVALGVAFLITLRWKISVHVGVIAGLAVVYTVLFGPRAIFFASLIPLVAWARVATGAHTPAQVLAGGVVSALVSGAVFSLLLAALT